MVNVVLVLSWSLTNSLRQELFAERTQALGLHVAYVETDMAVVVPSRPLSPIWELLIGCGERGEEARNLALFMAFGGDQYLVVFQEHRAAFGHERLWPSTRQDDEGAVR